jgi:Uma2 family endonuclease
MRYTEDDYLEGGPEWIGEVASSTESYDLHSKKRDYERAGVQEYLVVALKQQKVLWFVNRAGHFEEQPPDADGAIRSEVFPGLWLDSHALLQLNGKRLIAMLRKGVGTPQHASFVKRLAASSETSP